MAGKRYSHKINMREFLAVVRKYFVTNNLKK